MNAEDLPPHEFIPGLHQLDSAEIAFGLKAGMSMHVKLNDLNKLPHVDGQTVLLVIDDEWELAVQRAGPDSYWVA